jgi:hypothetical protein
MCAKVRHVKTLTGVQIILAGQRFKISGEIFPAYSHLQAVQHAMGVASGDLPIAIEGAGRAISMQADPLPQTDEELKAVIWPPR